MISIVLHWVVTALVLLLVAYLIPGFAISGFGSAMIVALVLGLISITIKPIVSLLTLPLNIVTLGLFSFVINALMLALAAAIVPGFAISSFWSALGAAVVLALVNALIDSFHEPKGLIH